MAVQGQIIDDKYEILALVGTGGMSKVFLARDKRLNKQWAVKEIQKNARDKNNEVVLQSAIAEANLIKSLDHPAIVRIVDIIENDTEIFIIEDYIEGETLGTILEAHGAQPQQMVIEWAMQMCEALEYLHTRKPPIIYRDMKPANIMLKPDGNIKVIDFGIAREYKEQGMADTVSLGTKGYAAPEQFGGKGQTDARTDVYCLGVTLYHLVTGHNPSEPPYELKPIRYWNPQLSAGLEAIIQKCTQQNPDDRYQSCAELLYALHHYEEYGAAYRAKQKRKLRAFLGAMVIMAAGLLVGGTGMYMQDYEKSANYAGIISEMEVESDSSTKIGRYAEAIDINPSGREAYFGMVNAIKEDSLFTRDEEKVLVEKVATNQTVLKNGSGNVNFYASLAYQIGNLYWLYYQYEEKSGASGEPQKTGGSQITRDLDSSYLIRMKSAVYWFNEVLAYEGGESADCNYNLARVYRDIGDFHRDITLKIQEASDSREIYSRYWDTVQQLMELVVDQPEESDIVRLEACRLCLYSIEQYARKFKSGGIEQTVLGNALERVESALLNIVTGQQGNIDDTEARKAYEERLEEYKKMLGDDSVSSQYPVEKLTLDIDARIEKAEKAVENAFR